MGLGVSFYGGGANHSAAVPLPALGADRGFSLLSNESFATADHTPFAERDQDAPEPVGLPEPTEVRRSSNYSHLSEGTHQYVANHPFVVHGSKDPSVSQVEPEQGGSSTGLSQHHSRGGLLTRLRSGRRVDASADEPMGEFKRDVIQVMGHEVEIKTQLPVVENSDSYTAYRPTPKAIKRLLTFVEQSAKQGRSLSDDGQPIDFTGVRSVKVWTQRSPETNPHPADHPLFHLDDEGVLNIYVANRHSPGVWGNRNVMGDLAIQPQRWTMADVMSGRTRWISAVDEY